MTIFKTEFSGGMANGEIVLWVIHFKGKGAALE
jgi:hypothetical protein